MPRTSPRLLPLVLLLACVPTPADDTGGADDTAGASTSEPTTAGAPPVCEPFEPYVIDVQAEPNGLYWRADEAALYIADDDNNRILRRADDGASSVFAAIPSPNDNPGADGLGDLDFAADGALYVPRFGFGVPDLGAIFRVAADGAPTALAGVDPAWRRVGLDYDEARGLLYVATFSKDSEGMFSGWVSTVDPVAGEEKILVEGLSKPVGVAVVGDTLYVGDQNLQILYKVDLTAESPVLAVVSDEFANLDLMEPTADGDLLLLSYDPATSTGHVYRVTPDGAYTTVAEGDWEPRGITFDGLSKIYVSARNTQTIVVLPAC
jgi:sugar lactone lactonase YvrE